MPDSEILALCRWGIRDGLYIIALLGFTVTELLNVRKKFLNMIKLIKIKENYIDELLFFEPLNWQTP